MKYWWVNHKQTVKQEVEEGYLWSPVHKRDGGRNQFYDNMKEAAPGDPVLSFAGGKIKYVGRVSDFAISSPIPSSFGATGKNWNTEGWLLPVRWKECPSPPALVLRILGLDSANLDRQSATIYLLVLSTILGTYCEASEKMRSRCLINQSLII